MATPGCEIEKRRAQENGNRKEGAEKLLRGTRVFS